MQPGGPWPVLPCFAYRKHGNYSPAHVPRRPVAQFRLCNGADDPARPALLRSGRNVEFDGFYSGDRMDVGSHANFVLLPVRRKAAHLAVLALSFIAVTATQASDRAARMTRAAGDWPWKEIRHASNNRCATAYQTRSGPARSLREFRSLRRLGYPSDLEVSCPHRVKLLETGQIPQLPKAGRHRRGAQATSQLASNPQPLLIKNHGSNQRARKIGFHCHGQRTLGASPECDKGEAEPDAASLTGRSCRVCHNGSDYWHETRHAERNMIPAGYRPGNSTLLAEVAQRA